MAKEVNQQSNKSVEERSELRKEIIKNFFTEFFKANWEKLPRLKELSGLSDEEIDSLPNNKPFLRTLTALMRVYQDKYRTYLLSKSGNPVNKEKATVMLDRILEGRNIPEGEEERVFGEKTGKIIDDKGNERLLFEGLTDRAMNEMINPFGGEELVFSTEYAQLVNLLARKLQQEGMLSSFEVAKLTLRASLQRPPGQRDPNFQYPEDLAAVINDPSFLRGERVPNELQFMDNTIFINRVPITESRMKDPNFVRQVKFLNILKSYMFRFAVDQTLKMISK